jgi:hypothetical protein
MKGVQFVLVAYLISIAAFAYAYNANSVAVREANNRAAAFKVESEARAAQFEEQNARQRYGLCGLQKYLATPSTTASQSNSTFRDVIGRLTGPDSLNCTPDPDDGK